MNCDPRELPPSSATGSGRLNGWKDIALHLGKGVRTAQRWEKLYRLPVHRIGREGGEIVFAFRHELDAWVGSPHGARGREDEATPDTTAVHDVAAAPPPPTPAPSRHVRAVLLIALALAGLAGAWWLATMRRVPVALSEPPVTAESRPATWRLSNGRLDVFDAAGALVFTRGLGADLPGTFLPQAAGLTRADPVQIVDLDGDGRSEVLVAAPALHAENGRLYCFESDGRLRFVRQPAGEVRFGAATYAAPWKVSHVQVTTGSDGRPSLWAAFSHARGFPSRLQELDARGGLEREYWSNGAVTFVGEARWRRDDVVLVGAANEETGGGSVAIFDRDAVGGRAPAVADAYRCTSCAAGGPREFIVFPPLCLARAQHRAPVVDAWIEGGDRLVVHTLQGMGAPDAVTTPRPLLAYYTLAAGLVPVHAEISREFQVVHAALEKRGLVDHAFGARDDADVFPLLRFEAGRFRALPAARVGH